MPTENMMVALIHWRIKPDDESISKFLNHWKTNNTIGNRKGLIAEFLSDSLKIADFPYITWHLDAESFGDFKSYVTVGLWHDAADFQEQVAHNFNDDKPMLEFEQYRRRRVVFRPVEWRIGDAAMPTGDSLGVENERSRGRPIGGLTPSGQPSDFGPICARIPGIPRPCRTRYGRGSNRSGDPTNR
jgi:hypothetical protein